MPRTRRTKKDVLIAKIAEKNEKIAEHNKKIKVLEEEREELQKQLDGIAILERKQAEEVELKKIAEIAKKHGLTAESLQKLLGEQDA